MAIEIGTETISITTQERTWRINIETPFNTVPTVTVYRELVKTDGNNIISRDQNAAVSQRTADAVTEQKYTALGASVTGAQLAALISVAADTWRVEDIAAEKERAEQMRVQANAVQAQTPG